MYGQTDRHIDRHMDIQTYGQTDIWIDRHKDRETDTRTDIQMDRQTYEQTYRWTDNRHNRYSGIKSKHCYITEMNVSICSSVKCETV